MNHPREKSSLKPEKILSKLQELLESGKLEDSELSLLENIVNRKRADIESNPKMPETSTIESKGENIDVGVKKGNKPLVTTKNVLNALKNLDGIEFGIIGTDGSRPGHNIQFKSSATKQELNQELFNIDNNLPENLKNDKSVLLVRFIQDNQLGNRNALLLRVADNRVDNGGGNHTTIFFLIQKGIEKSQFEEFAKDNEGVKEIMRIILDKTKSPLRGAETWIKRSFLI